MNKFVKYLDEYKWSILSLFLFISGFTYLLYHGISAPYEITNYINTSSQILVFSLLLYLFTPAYIKKNSTHYSLILFYFSVAMILIFIVLNSINIYHLDSYYFINKLCSNQTTLCDFTRKLFFASKAFRFITISPIVLIYPSIYFFLLFILNQYYNRLSYLFKNPFRLFIIALILVSSFNNFQSVFSQTIHNIPQTILNISVPFNERFVYKQGGNTYLGWVWTFTQFLNRNTPADSTIAIPPEGSPWEMEGNSLYIRWFIYPRKTVNWIKGSIPDEADYIIITSGIYLSSETSWPKLEETYLDNLDSIILFDRESQQEKVISIEEISTLPNKYLWGLINLK